jgi:UDP-N-acetylglucosamine 2-epimerase
MVSYSEEEIKMLKVATVIGTRPEIIKLSRVIPALDKAFDHILIHTNQNYAYGLNRVFFEEMNIRRPDFFLKRAGDKTAIETIGRMLTQLDDQFSYLKPEAILILGDTNSCVAAAYVAKRRKIPVFHMEAGNRCFDLRVPEEINRKTVDHLSDINMPYTEIAKWNLIRDGFPADRVIKTGSPMMEVLNHYGDRIDHSNIVSERGLMRGEYFLVSCHREENVDSPERLRAFVRMLNNLAGKYNRPVIVSTHPRTQAKLDAERFIFHPNVKLSDPFGLYDYVQLQKFARIVISDSGTITEESSILGFPALNIREAHERPEGMEEGAVPMVGFNLDRIFSGIEILKDRTRMGIPADYNVENVSEKVVSILLSYTDYVNRKIWGKS